MVRNTLKILQQIFKVSLTILGHPYKHTTCIPLWNDVETFQRGIHVVCLYGLCIEESKFENLGFEKRLFWWLYFTILLENISYKFYFIGTSWCSKYCIMVKKSGICHITDKNLNLHLFWILFYWNWVIFISILFADL